MTADAATHPATNRIGQIGDWLWGPLGIAQVPQISEQVEYRDAGQQSQYEAQLTHAFTMPVKEHSADTSHRQAGKQALLA